MGRPAAPGIEFQTPAARRIDDLEVRPARAVRPDRRPEQLERDRDRLIDRGPVDLEGDVDRLALPGVGLEEGRAGRHDLAERVGRDGLVDGDRQPPGSGRVLGQRVAARSRCGKVQPDLGRPAPRGPGSRPIGGDRRQREDGFAIPPGDPHRGLRGGPELPVGPGRAGLQGEGDLQVARRRGVEGEADEQAPAIGGRLRGRGQGRDPGRLGRGDDRGRLGRRGRRLGGGRGGRGRGRRRVGARS